jgi:putative acetyltransferase
MRAFVNIRHYRHGEEPELFKVYYSAIHLIACQHYTQQQLRAWAPCDLDLDLWCSKIRSIRPFVAELDGIIVGYADLQLSGYIDHFFVSGTYPHRGIGTQLMHHLLALAKVQGVPELTSDVSLTAQPFYERFGFSVVEQRFPERRGVVLPNALMRRQSQ